MSDTNEPYDLTLLGESEMARRIRAYDWASTPLGPIEGWPMRLLMSLTSTLKSRFQFVIYWGPDLICLYNDAEIPTLGDWHPGALGQPASTLLATMWDVVGPQLRSVLAGGPSTWAEDEPLLFDRTGQIEEAYFTYSYSPIHDALGNVGGVLLATNETTNRVIGERQLRTLQAVAAQASTASSVETVCAAAAQALVTNPDIAFAQVYLRKGRELELAAASEPFLEAVDWLPRDVLMHETSTTLVDVPTEDDSPRQAVAVPIAAAGLPIGVLVAGIERLRPFDERQLGFLELVGGLIGSALTAHRALALAAASAEREQIERDLHDSVQQQWVAAAVKVGLARGLVATDPGKAIELLDDIAVEIDVALMQMRDVVQGLYPALLQDQGLYAALEPVCRRSPVDVHLEGATLGRFDEELETAVYYVCLEALQNSAKHGGLGTTAKVDLKRDSDILRVRISDTGPGFEPAAVRAGTGLQNMRSRIEAVGGTFELSSATGKGTTVSAFVPLRGDGQR